jgi:hypothetical protein
MHDQNYCSSQTTKLAKALIQVQRTLQPATKDRLNPFTHSNYATLNSVMDSCREALLSNVVWFSSIMSLLSLDVKSGQGSSRFT